jgi:hypothetical protein
MGGGGGSTIPVQTGAPTAPDSPTTETALWYDSDATPGALQESAVGFRGGRDSSQSISNSSWTTITSLNSYTTRNDGGWTYNATSHGWTVPVSGWYVLRARGQFAGSSGGDRRYVSVTQNGNQLGDTQVPHSSVTGSINVHNTQIYYCEAGDYIGMRVWQNSGGALNVTWASIEMVLTSGVKGDKGDPGDVFTAAPAVGIEMATTSAQSTSSGWHTVSGLNGSITKNVGNMTYDTNGVYIPEDGWYTVYGGAKWGGSGGTVRILRIFLNGAGNSEEHQEWDAFGGGHRTTMSYTKWFQAGDHIGLGTYHNTSTINVDNAYLNVARVNGAKGDQGDKGDTGNLPAQSGAKLQAVTSVTTVGWAYETYDTISRDDGGYVKGTSGNYHFEIPTDGWYLVHCAASAVSTTGCDTTIHYSDDGGTTKTAGQGVQHNHHSGTTSQNQRTTSVWLSWHPAGRKIYGRRMGATAIDTSNIFTIAAIGGPKGDKGDTGNLPVNTGARIAHPSNFTVPSASVWTQVTGLSNTSYEYDTEGILTIGTDSITVEQAGFYNCSVRGYWQNMSSGTLRAERITINGSTHHEKEEPVSGYAYGYWVNHGEVLYLNAGDVVTVQVFQDASASFVFYSPSLAVTLVGGPKGDKGDAGYVPEGDTEWRSPTFLNSWVNYDTTTYGPAGYRKDANGFVHLRGLVKNGTSTTATMFILPAGYRPGRDVLLSQATAASGTGSANDFRITKDGYVQFNLGGSTSWSSIHATFYAESS